MKALTKAILAIGFLLLAVSCLPLTLNAAVPHLINYQGRLTDKDNKPLEGAYTITFRIYDAETAGNLLWEEIQSGVVIQKGIFSVLLGSVTDLNIPFDKPYFLEIKVGNEVMSPRQRITSSGYAIRAEVAEYGVPRGVIVMWSGTIKDIPAGWALCDGTNGTPDLRDRFVAGARQDDNGVAKTNISGALSQNGGSVTISVSNLPSHQHGAGNLTTDIAGEHAHQQSFGSQSGSGADQLVNSYSVNNVDFYGGANTRAGGKHSHEIVGSTDSTGSGTPYTQPYYALAYIMKL